jgi:predicted aspartyl protease
LRPKLRGGILGKVLKMGRIVASVKIENLISPDKKLRCDALVDTGASHMVLPTAWRDRLGDLEQFRRVQLETATQASVEGAVCGPVRIQIEGFEPICSEVVFVDMDSADGDYEPLVGYLVLEQSQAAVDMLGHRLIHVKRLDLKRG